MSSLDSHFPVSFLSLLWWWAARRVTSPCWVDWSYPTGKTYEQIPCISCMNVVFGSFCIAFGSSRYYLFTFVTQSDLRTAGMYSQRA
jgi:hypothetical protein